MAWAKQKQRGFTIVELLIVVVVIAILAAITIVAYSGIQNRTNDSAVQADLRNFGQKVQEYITLNNTVPLNLTALSSTNMKVTKSAYGSHYLDLHNLLYCARSSDNAFAMTAASKSGKVFAYMQGRVQEIAGPLTTNGTMCGTIGISSADGAPWIYTNGAWVSWI